MSKLEDLIKIKSEIKQAIENKGVEVSPTDTFHSYANKINAIKTNSNEWKPQSDWWNIDKIFEEDSENYPYKMVTLLNDCYDSTSFQSMGAELIKYSDDTQDVNTTSGLITHVWDKSKDKECSLGYKTRYIIHYCSTDNRINGNYYFFDNTNQNTTQLLYQIIKMGRFSPRNWFINCRNLECVKYIDTTYNSGLSYNFGDCQALKKVEGFKIGNVTQIYCPSYPHITEDDFNSFEFPSDYTTVSANSLFSGNQYFNIKMPINIDFSKCTDYSNFLRNSLTKTLDVWNVTSMTSCINSFANSNIISIGKIIGNIKINGLNLTNCYSLNHDTLIKFLNALYDYKSEGSTTTYTLTLGTTNLAKLTDDEKAIATMKGWVLS